MHEIINSLDDVARGFFVGVSLEAGPADYAYYYDLTWHSGYGSEGAARRAAIDAVTSQG